MATEFTWHIVALDRDPSTGVIHTAHWTLDGVDGEHTGRSYGSASVPQAPAGTKVTPFEKVTEDDVLGWLSFSGVDREEQEKLVQSQIDESRTPATASGLPWAEEAE